MLILVISLSEPANKYFFTSPSAPCSGLCCFNKRSLCGLFLQCQTRVPYRSLIIPLARRSFAEAPIPSAQSEAADGKQLNSFTADELMEDAIIIVGITSLHKNFWPIFLITRKAKALRFKSLFDVWDGMGKETALKAILIVWSFAKMKWFLLLNTQ